MPGYFVLKVSIYELLKSWTSFLAFESMYLPVSPPNSSPIPMPNGPANMPTVPPPKVVAKTAWMVDFSATTEFGVT